MQFLDDNPTGACLWKASWQAAVLVLMVLAAQAVFRRRLQPRVRYGLWLLVVLRLALPWTAPSPVSVFNLLSFREARVESSGKPPRLGVPQPASPNPAALAGPRATRSGSSLWPARAATWRDSLVGWLLVLWSAGVLTLFACVSANHVRLWRGIRRRRPLLDPTVLNLLEHCKQTMGVRVPVILVETTAVGSPALFGFVRPRLLLPAGMTRSFSLEELRCVFLHELAHVKRRDILFGWITTALQILHWFNPLVWFAFHRMRLDRELACDALALSYARAEENQLYGQTIIKLLQGFGRPAWAPGLVGIVENKNQMKERIRMIATFKRTNRSLAPAFVLFASLGIITLTDAQPSTEPLAKSLPGTWVLVGSPGEVGQAPAAGGRIKVITEKSWSATQTDPKTGATIVRLGGTYSLKGDDYQETVDYSNESSKELLKKTFKFTIKLEGDTLTLLGVGNPWKEVWKRATSESLKPHKVEPTNLQGKWVGEEVGNGPKNSASLVIKGSNLEFRGADTNEWYKATFSVFDTTPKQVVVEITDCAFPQYVGKTSYALLRLQEGTLTLTGNEPGSPLVPATFEAQGTRRFDFRKE